MLLKLNLKIICIILSILIIACAGFWIYGGRFVAVILTLSPEEDLFDVDVEIPLRYKEVSPGEEILVQLTLYNLKRVGPVDVVVEYGIEDTSGNVIISSHETLGVETQVSFIRRFYIFSDLKPDYYVFFARVRYNDVVRGDSESLGVITKEELWMGKITRSSLIVIIFVLLIIVITLNLYKRMK